MSSTQSFYDAIGSTLAYLLFFWERATPSYVQVPHTTWLSFTRPSPALVLQATNAGARRPGYEATRAVQCFKCHYLTPNSIWEKNLSHPWLSWACHSPHKWFIPNSKQHYWSCISCLIHLPHHHLGHWHQLHGQQSILCHNCLVDKRRAGEPTNGEIHTELWKKMKAPVVLMPRCCAA